MENRREEKQEGIVYIVNDYKQKKPVTTDLETGKKVVIVSTEQDVLSYYGLILEKYGQFNLVLVDNYAECTEEFVEEASKLEQTKDEVITYVGTPLSEMIIKTIGELKLNEKQARIMALIQEVIKDDKSDAKMEATLKVLNDRIKQLSGENAQLKTEIDALNTQVKEVNSTTGYVKHVNLDSFTSQTQVMYIRELGSVSYFDSMLKNFHRYTREKLGKRTKVVIFDNRNFDILYREFNKVTDTNEYLANRILYSNEDLLVCSQIFPNVISDLYKSGFDTLIIVDRILNYQDMVTGRNVHKYISLDANRKLQYALEQKDRDPNITIIAEKSLKYTGGIIIGGIDKPGMDDPNTAYYWYCKLPNLGDDNRRLFDVINDINQPKSATSRR